MAETVNYQCINCSGTLGLDPSSGLLHCEYCDSSFTVQEVEAFYAAKQERADERAEAEEKREEARRRYAAVGAAEGTAAGVGEAAGDTASVAADEAADFAGSGAGGVAGASASGDKEPVPVISIEDFLKRAPWVEMQGDNLSSYICSSCGAELLTDGTTAVTECPYCGNSAVMPGTLSGVLQPDYVIPFKVTREQACEALSNYGKGKFLLPKDFLSANHLEHIKGVYVPFWLYSGKAHVNANYAATNVRCFVAGDKEITETDHYELWREGEVSYDLIPVDGSAKMPDAHMDAIEPFDYSELKDFSVAYLPGFMAERYDMDVSACEPRARLRLENTAPDAIARTISGYDTVDSNACTVDNQWTDIRYALLPVWLLHSTYNGDDYLFAMNGQTGRFIGDLPVDKGRSVLYFFICFIIAFLITVVISYFVLS